MPAVSEATTGTNHMSTHVDTGAAVDRSLREASLGRLACLLRHWAWADEARSAFDRELASDWDDNDDPMSTIRLAPTITGARCCAASVKRHSSTDCYRRPGSTRSAGISRSVWPVCGPVGCFAMKRRSDGCGASMTRSVKRSARSGSRVRLIHSITEYQSRSSETVQPCDRRLREITSRTCSGPRCA
jgi:hypothetical protein